MPPTTSNLGEDRRPPVVAILGHIDHGKSTLIDYIRKSNVVGKEAGGITQHASAYEITHTTKDGKTQKITFLDTPGHEAFGSIRNRCTNVADIAALIVSAEDGAKPQTLEVYKQIQECALNYFVVITKVDKPAADLLKTKQSLAESGIYVEGYGGNVPVVEISAKTGQGVDEFLDMIELMSQMDGKTANRGDLASGIIIESRVDPKRGIVAVGIIKDGSIKQGLFAASANTIAPIRYMLNADGEMVEELSFSSPVQIVGWDKMPVVGMEFKTFLTKDQALAYAGSFGQEFFQKKQEIKTTEGPTIPIILKTDTAGSLEVISTELNKLIRARIAPQIISSGVGSVNENDIKTGMTADGVVVVSFNTKVDPQAAALAERSSVPIYSFTIIYELKDKINQLLTEKEPRVEVEEVVSTAKVLKLFGATKENQVLGGKVLTGTFKKGLTVKIKRRGIELGSGKVRELQQSKIVTDAVNEGVEFGAMIESKLEIAPGDTMDAVVMVTK